MASSEDEGANGGSSEAGEEKETAKKRRLGFLATAWLTFYNIAMTAGWLVLAIAMVRFYLEKGTHKGLYKSIQKTLKFFQTFALLEIVHCIIGIVPTSVLVTGVQVSSRIFMVWLITHSIKPIQNEDSVVLFLVAWTVTEITRYSFYTFNLLNHLPYFIKWARYNFFIILYPVGVVGELLTIYAALPYVKKTGMFSLRLPNKYNVSFDYYYFLLLTMASYIPYEKNGGPKKFHGLLPITQQLCHTPNCLLPIPVISPTVLVQSIKNSPERPTLGKIFDDGS
ncbi:very-long-chain (3R)-3-hydroxyacyl-CoA dehydratase 1 isoform X1 [Dromiciops gliroides]|uniref:very-long-chain (3R)-3-hydroxyacyl-CoA dehydratase 1 isoform X1 n=1 Tax=Dromiciops gliroides TaxID=33562 RepID=UPI001CC4BEA3|nr:very-long-chain (3R)-3-hydroxyacyl-CoA dehydratase 1 isoform X1 [Dromiciops gliroides]